MASGNRENGVPVRAGPDPAQEHALRPLRAALRRLRRASRAHSRKQPGSAVAVEDLNVTGMIANKKLARAVSDQGFGTARRMLAYKSARNGGTLLVADRWYPSSKTCSAGHSELKREPGTRPQRRKTGTAPQQCEAAAEL